MGRKKIRNFNSKQYYEVMFETYFAEHHDEVIADLLEHFGYTNFEQLQEDEYRMKWGFDCGWTMIVPRDSKMRHEWELDNGKYDCKIFAHPSYYPQSTTLQRVQVEKAVKDLGLSEMFYVTTKLD